MKFGPSHCRLWFHRIIHGQIKRREHRAWRWWICSSFVNPIDLQLFHHSPSLNPSPSRSLSLLRSLSAFYWRQQKHCGSQPNQYGRHGLDVRISLPSPFWDIDTCIGQGLEPNQSTEFLFLYQKKSLWKRITGVLSTNTPKPVLDWFLTQLKLF